MSRFESAVQAACNAGNGKLADAGVQGIGLCRHPYCNCRVMPEAVKAAVSDWDKERAFQPRRFREDAEQREKSE